MRNKNINQKGNTDVKLKDRILDITKAGVSDSNENWYDLQTYYDEDEYQGENSKKNEKAYEAVERGKAFVRGRMIMMALEEEARQNIRNHRRELQVV